MSVFFFIDFKENGASFSVFLWSSQFSIMFYKMIIFLGRRERIRNDSLRGDLRTARVFDVGK